MKVVVVFILRSRLMCGRRRARGALVPDRQEAVACDGDGMPVFDRLRYRRQDGEK